MSSKYKSEIQRQDMNTADKPRGTTFKHPFESRLDVDEPWSQYLAGNQFLGVITASATSVLPNQLPGLAMGTPARELAETTSASLGISFEQFKPMIQFAVAVNTLVYNCGEQALDIIFDPINPQSDKSVRQLANTSDTRQRYRINQVITNKSRTIRPQGSDPVFDTVSFSEVPSRLARARGVLVKLSNRTDGIREPAVVLELKRLLHITQNAATQLEKLVRGKEPTASVIQRLDKARLFPILRSREVTGRDVGYGRQVLRFVVKNVWDYGEMRRRKLIPTKHEKARVCQELALIKSTVKRILEN